MVVIGLTGNFGAGKSEVARFLRERGAEVLSADEVGHEAYRPGTEGWREVVSAFGEGILAPDGTVDRGKLGARVFSEPQARERLNAILHPRMKRMMAERIRSLREKGARAIVLEAALLLEAGWDDLVDEVWTVTAPEEVVLRRLREKNGLPEEAVRARLSAQMPQEEKARRAQVVVDNSGDLEHLRRQVEHLWTTRIAAKVGNDDNA